SPDALLGRRPTIAVPDRSGRAEIVGGDLDPDIGNLPRPLPVPGSDGRIAQANALDVRADLLARPQPELAQRAVLVCAHGLVAAPRRGSDRAHPLAACQPEHNVAFAGRQALPGMASRGVDID